MATKAQTAWTIAEATEILVLAVKLGAVRAFDPETRERVPVAQFARRPDAFSVHRGDYEALVERMRQAGLVSAEPQGSA